MKKCVLSILVILFMCLSQISAIAAEDVSAESLASLLSDAGYSSYVDEEGDVIFKDDYGLEYWVIADYLEENKVFIQGAWLAEDNVTSNEANRLMNECNSKMYTIRSYYEPLSRAFFIDYALYYGEILEDTVFLSVIADFLYESDIFTDYLIGEKAI